jgi:hypothetical protein
LLKIKVKFVDGRKPKQFLADSFDDDFTLPENEEEETNNMFDLDFTATSSDDEKSELDYNVLAEISNITYETPQGKRMTCCACAVTNRSDVFATFTKVPKTTIVINEKSSYNKRFQFHRETFRRKVYLNRFGLTLTNKNETNLTFCSHHQLQSEMFEFPWKNSNGKRMVTDCKLVVPVNVGIAALVPTRANRLIIHSPPPKRVRTPGPSFEDKENEDNRNHLRQLENPFTTLLTNTETEVTLEKRKRIRKCSYHRCPTRSADNMTRIPSLCSRIPKQFYTHNFERLLRAAKLVHRPECF